MLRAYIILTAYLAFTIRSHSQAPWRIESLGVTEGLSQGYIYVIHQDKKGFIWIGTHGGLNRYDGYEFRIFQYTPFNFSTLGDNGVFFLKEDPVNSKFWIGGSSCLNEFDPETFVNTRYRYSDKQLEFADGVFINDHELLLACEYDVLLFNTRDKKFTEIPVYDYDSRPIEISRVENASIDRNGNAMIMCKTGIYFYDPSTRTCKRKTPGSPDFSAFDQTGIFNVLHDSRGFYWIATNKMGLVRYNPVNDQLKKLALSPPLKQEAVRFEVIVEDSRGDIWVGSSHGLFLVNPNTLTYEYFSKQISSPEINAIYEDRNHAIWVGTVGSGISKLERHNVGFKNVMLSKEEADLKTGSYIMGLQQDGDDIWFVNIWDQVGKVDLVTGQVNIQHMPAGYNWYSEGSIVKERNGDLVVLNGAQLLRIQKQKGILQNGLPTPGLTHIFHTGNGKTWYMVKAPVIKTFSRQDTIYGNQFFYDAIEDNNGNIWIGSSSGLIRFDVKNNSFTHFRHDDNNTNTVSSDFIYLLELDDSSHNIWMAAYHGGLCSYHIPSGRFSHLSTEDGMPDNIVYALEKDSHGNLWFSSNVGLSAYNSHTKTFRNYGLRDGLINHEFNRRASLKNEKGWLFFGGISGIDYFHPDSITKTSTVQNLSFTGFSVFNKTYIPANKSGLPFIELKHNERNISVQFASLDYSEPQKIQYAYRIDDNEWIKTGNQYKLSISALSKGMHRLSVRSTNSEGAWLDNEISCLIMVRPAWWQTWWFKAMIAAALAGLLIGGIRFYYLRKLEKQKAGLEKQQAIEKERTRIATDMHDDLGAGLSRIKFLSETIAIKKMKQESVETDINSIREYSHEMIDKMGEIVWALNEKNDSLSDLLSFTRSYAVEYLTQHGINVRAEIGDEVPARFVTGEFRRNVYLAVKEALHNIVKHAQANEVLINFFAKSGLTITIHDNGKGYNPAQVRPFSNGLGNMTKRMEHIGGNFEIINANGTIVKLWAPLPR